MGKKPRITILGPGRLGSALASSLKRAGYKLDELVSRDAAPSVRRAIQVASKLGCNAVPLADATLDAELVWICVGDAAIRNCAETLAARESVSWKRKLVFHASGALSSDELRSLRERGASVASVHPMMSFVHSARPSLKRVTFALEGDSKAVGAARTIVRNLKAESISLAREAKALYHAWGGFSSPLLIAELATADLIAQRLGLTPLKARKTLAPILRQTIENYIAHGPAAAFSGPLVRGDAGTVRSHLEALKQVPQARQVYLTLVKTAMNQLPVANRAELQKLIEDS